MTALNLGVTDVPYSHTANQGKSKKGKRRASTTGDVAEILEAKYGIMEYFWKIHQSEIIAAMSDGIEGQFESLMQGAPPNLSLFNGASGEIEALFMKFLSQKEMDNKVPGVPTKASLGGQSLRFKKKRNPKVARPSFIDTSLYENSMRAWVK